MIRIEREHENTLASKDYKFQLHIILVRRGFRERKRKKEKQCTWQKDGKSWSEDRVTQTEIIIIIIIIDYNYQ